jgi:hypothetical protein
MSGIEAGDKRHLAGQMPEGQAGFAGQGRQDQGSASLHQRAAAFAPALRAATQPAAPGTAPARKTDEDEIDFAPFHPAGLASLASPLARADAAAAPTAGREGATTGMERIIATLSEAATRAAPTPGIGADGAMRVPLDVAVFGAHAATINVTATEIHVLLHGAPGLAPPDPRAMAEAAAKLALVLSPRLADRRVSLGYAEDAPNPVDGADGAPRFNPLLGPVR